MSKRTLALLAATFLASGCATKYPELPSAPVVAPQVNEAIEEEPAIRSTDPGDTIGGAQTYVWQEDRKHVIYATNGDTVPVSLIKGERIREVTATDHYGWNNSVISYGAGRSDTPVVVLTPNPGEAKRTTAIITTNKRMYLLDLVPRRKGHETVRFYAPQKIKKFGPPKKSVMRSYTLQGPFAPWRPIQVTDDGAQTWVKFDPSVTATGMPTLVGIDDGGTERPLNASRVGDHIVADGIFKIIRIRMGDEHVDARRI